MIQRGPLNQTAKSVMESVIGFHESRAKKSQKQYNIKISLLLTIQPEKGKNTSVKIAIVET